MVTKEDLDNQLKTPWYTHIFDEGGQTVAKYKKDHSKPPKANWDEESIPTYRAEAIRAAKQLGYDKQCLKEVRFAETKDAIANVMSRGRHRQMKLEEEAERIDAKSRFNHILEDIEGGSKNG